VLSDPCGEEFEEEQTSCAVDLLRTTFPWWGMKATPEVTPIDDKVSKVNGGWRERF